MARRVFEIAKELGVKSKAVVEKCHAEGIPEDIIKGHMSSVSAGLEQTIREWFATEGEGSTTAVETSEKVDLKKVAAPAKRRKATSADAGDDEAIGEGGGVEVAEPPAEGESTDDATTDTDGGTEGDDEQGDDAGGAPTTATPLADDEPAEAIESEQAKPASPMRPRGVMVPAGLTTAPTPSAEPTDKTPATPAASTDDDKPAGGNNGESSPRLVKAPPPPPSRGPATPAPMNVPTRPTVITPAGPQLAKTPKKKVELSGPKVVRVEAAEQVDVPRRRGPRPGGGGGGPGGGGFGGPMSDPGGRDPRGGGGGAGGQNRRRTGGGVPARRRGVADGPDGGSGSGWTEQDLAEREARLQRSGGYLKQKRQQLRRSSDRPETPAQKGGKVTVSAPFTIKDLSAATGVKAAEIVKHLFMQGIMTAPNAVIDSDKAQEIMMEYDIELEVVEAKTAEEKVSESFVDREAVDERPRGPVVTILGHVDHGKTSLLDKIRHANVAAGEAGGITQATSAFKVPIEVGDEKKEVVFIDTPGHEAFTEMRSRGANVTDIVVLVVAADDGVMPQTAESISHAKAAGVPIVVALNKIDKPEATDSNIQKILGQLAEHELNPTDWGGDTEVVRTSATKGEGIDDLLEILDLQAQVLEMKADFGGPARGTVIESRQVEGRGAVANILVQDGELKVGDFIVAGRAFGRVRDMTDDRGQRQKSAYPPSPVQISGIDLLPDAGDKFYIVDTLKKAEQAAQQRRDREREEQLAQPKLTLDTMFTRMDEAELKEITVVVKADVQGSVDVLKHEIEKVSGDEVKVRVIHSAVGGITKSDILLADASRAVIVGFNVIANAEARSLAETKGVEIRNYQVIYDIVEDMKKAAEGLLEPELRQEVLGHAEVRKVFKVSKVGSVAGCYITDGVVQRDAFIRVTRNDIVIENDRKLEQLKRFKEDAKEVRSGMECGMKIIGYDDIKEGDILECYKQVEVKRTL